MENHNEQPYDRVLFERLRSLQRETAEEEGLKAWEVFNDGQLKKLCRAFPTTERDFLTALYDKKKYELYGDAFIEVIQDYLDNPPPKIDAPLPSFLFPLPIILEGFLEPINEELKKRELPEIAVHTVTSRLLELGFWESRNPVDSGEGLPNEQGMKAGIEIQRNLIRGSYEFVNDVVYHPSAQLLLIGLLYEMRLLP